MVCLGSYLIFRKFAKAKLSRCNSGAANCRMSLHRLKGVVYTNLFFSVFFIQFLLQFQLKIRTCCARMIVKDVIFANLQKRNSCITIQEQPSAEFAKADILRYILGSSSEAEHFARSVTLLRPSCLNCRKYLQHGSFKKRFMEICKIGGCHCNLGTERCRMRLPSSEEAHSAHTVKCLPRLQLNCPKYGHIGCIRKRLN